MKSIYWSTTIIIAAYHLWSAYTFIFSKPTIAALKDLGFPQFFATQLGILKIIASIIILIPSIPMIFKHWAYAGLFLFIITGVIAHHMHKDPIYINLINLALAIILAISYYYLYKIKGLI